MNQETIDLLAKYGLKIEDLDNVRNQMIYSLLLLMDAADSFTNIHDTMLYNSCGELKASDDTHYQVQVFLVPDKENWIPVEGVYHSTPIVDNDNIN